MVIMLDDGVSRPYYLFERPRFRALLFGFLTGAVQPGCVAAHTAECFIRTWRANDFLEVYFLLAQPSSQRKVGS